VEKGRSGRKVCMECVCACVCACVCECVDGSTHFGSTWAPSSTRRSKVLRVEGTHSPSPTPTARFNSKGSACSRSNKSARAGYSSTHSSTCQQRWGEGGKGGDNTARGWGTTSFHGTPHNCTTTTTTTTTISPAHNLLTSSHATLSTGTATKDASAPTPTAAV
jgi:hypothetical protein